ncbi:MAG: hypothetical protein GXO25_01655 [Euryarchaeota archaeon]|nr:hypothetical protein [Euryarchaeota archaeon]
MKLIIWDDGTYYYFEPKCGGTDLHADKNCLKAILSLYEVGKIKSAKGKIFEFEGNFDYEFATVEEMGYSTNIVVGFDGYVLKSYRRIGSREPELMRVAGEIAPEICGWGKYDGQYIQLITRKITGKDVGKMFYENYVNFEKNAELELLPINELVGVVVRLHKKFETLGMEEITEEDISAWRKYVMKMQKQAGLNLDLKLNTLFSEMIGKEKMVTHQDLHFSQMLWSDRRIYVVDFEGEPMRGNGYEKLQPVRDVSTLARAVGYITSGSWDDWERNIVMKIYEEYRRESHYRFDMRDYAEWMIEKAVYEINYELQNRPNMVYVPMRGLKNSIKFLEEIA